ncbi:MAG: NUDIX domain-containing protein [Candidatus Acidiferrales bacterium]
MLTVVAALIESNGKLLVCQRKRGDTFELMWEFPGGKLKPGESPAEALARELEEELGVASEIGAEVMRARHQYAQMSEPIELIFLRARITGGTIENRVFESIEWREAQTLPELNFLPADRDLIHLLATGKLKP